MGRLASLRGRFNIFGPLPIVTGLMTVVLLWAIGLWSIPLLILMLAALAYLTLLPGNADRE